SKIVERSGGLTKEAYAVGARLERIMTPEEKLRMRTAIRMAAGAGKDSISTKTLDMDTTYYVGIELEKAMAKPGGSSDLVLREGDRIIVPQFTNTVKINGAVMYPNTVTYMDGKKLKYYIDMAGGFGARAKKRSAYVIYMNGTVARLKARSRNAIRPGCEIIVPTKQGRKGLSFGEIMSLSTSAASLATMAATMVGVFKK
ncbi:MAG: SLBB domain-containing protein, partial [Bacteroides sp.]